MPGDGVPGQKDGDEGAGVQSGDARRSAWFTSTALALIILASMWWLFFGRAGGDVETSSADTTSAVAPATSRPTIPDPPTTLALPQKDSDPIFVFNWEAALPPPPPLGETDPVSPSLTWEQLANLTDDEIRRLPAFDSQQVIPGFSNDLLHTGGSIFPFPLQQFAIEPPTDPTAGEYCANDHYTGAVGIDLNGLHVPEPDGLCAWGDPEIGDGLIYLTNQQLADWLADYRG